jgi:hypothetical protein
MEETNAVKPGDSSALSYRCSKCKFRVAVKDGDLDGLGDYCSNPETQRQGLGILNVVWGQIKELHNHNILTYIALKGMEKHLKSCIDQVQDFGIPLNTPYGQKCFVAKEEPNG